MSLLSPKQGDARDSQLKMLRHFFESCNFRVERLQGGLSTVLYSIEAKQSGAKLLVRLKDPTKSLLVDPEIFHQFQIYLYHHGMGRKIYWSNAVCQVEEWIQGEPLNLQNVRSPAIANLIAKQLAKFHAVPLTAFISEALARDWAIISAQSPFAVSSAAEYLGCKSTCWSKIMVWASHILEHQKDHLYLEEAIGLEAICELIQSILDRGAEYHLSVMGEAITPVEIVTSHNDLLPGNIILIEDTAHPPSPGVKLIDFEYGGQAERIYDIANHLWEYTGFDCDTRLYPSKSVCLSFLNQYLVESFPSEPNPRLYEVAKTLFLPALEVYRPVSHLFWGLWSALSARSSSRELSFDYQGYAIKRLQMAFHPETFEPEAL